MRRAVRSVLAFLSIMVGCGGGDSSAPPSSHTEVLIWRQPAFFNDNLPMDIRKDVARWDIYCSPVPSFIDNDLAAHVVNPDNLTFNLSLLRGFGIEPGESGKFVSIKCVGIDNQASDFSEPVLWEN